MAPGGRRRTALALTLSVIMLGMLAGAGALSDASSAASRAYSTVGDMLVGPSGIPQRDDGTPAQDQFCAVPGRRCGQDRPHSHAPRPHHVHHRHHHRRHRHRHRHTGHHYHVRHQGPHRRDKRHR